jgi:PilZ domain
VNQEVIQPPQDGASLDSPPQKGAAAEKLIHLALPVRLTHMNSDAHGGSELACTYDIHPRGARLLSFRNVAVGDLITVERGRTKSVCRVVWAGDPKSALRGQFTVECVEGTRTPWEDELRQMEEQYLPLLGDAKHGNSAAHNVRKGESNRRRGPRFQVAGEADLAEIGGRSRVEGRLEQLSQYGCLVSASDLLTPGTGLRMVLNIYDVSLALKGDVKYTAGNRSMGVEFREIRQGDRPLLEYVLGQLKKPRRDDFADLEVVTESLAAVAG